MGLSDRFGTVQQMGGKIVRSADGAFVVQGVDDRHLSPAIVTALNSLAEFRDASGHATFVRA